MADIELITDGIAREIIEANKENNEKLINTLHDIDKTTILLSGKHKYVNEVTYEDSLEEYPDDPEPILYEVKGKGVLLNSEIGIYSSYSNGGKLEVILDGEIVLYASKPSKKPNGTEDNTKWTEWMKFEESLEVKHIRGSYEANLSYRLHYVLL